MSARLDNHRASCSNVVIVWYSQRNSEVYKVISIELILTNNITVLIKPFNGADLFVKKHVHLHAGYIDKLK